MQKNNQLHLDANPKYSSKYVFGYRFTYHIKQDYNSLCFGAFKVSPQYCKSQLQSVKEESGNIF